MLGQLPTRYVSIAARDHKVVGKAVARNRSREGGEGFGDRACGGGDALRRATRPDHS